MSSWSTEPPPQATRSVCPAAASTMVPGGAATVSGRGVATSTRSSCPRRVASAPRFQGLAARTSCPRAAAGSCQPRHRSGRVARGQ